MCEGICVVQVQFVQFGQMGWFEWYYGSKV